MITEEVALKLVGLSESEAENRLQVEGFNELPTSKPRAWYAIAGSVLSEPMLIFLLGCSGIYFFLGDPNEAFILLGSALLVVGITFYQERRSERALEALRDLSSPRALVIRDGQRKRIPGKDVVRGDLIVLSEGDRVPADAAVLWTSSLEADEAILTGESVAVRKSAWDRVSPFPRAGGEDLPLVFSSTLIVKGRGIAEVIATASNTEMGKIGKSLSLLGQESTQIQKEVKQLVRVLGVIGGSLCIILAILYVLLRGGWLQGILSGLSLAMAVLPEEFPVVLTIFLALGAWRMSKKNILTRRVASLETLGQTTVLCVDKTGTLTENKMVVHELRTTKSSFRITEESAALPENFSLLAEFAILASPKNPYDPMELAIHSTGARFFEANTYPAKNWQLAKEYPLSRELLAVTNVWSQPDSTMQIIAAKGALEAIAELCHIEGDELDQVHRLAMTMSLGGLRVLGVARSQTDNTVLPDDPHDFHFELIGLVGLYDPPKKSVPAAVKECYTAGIKIVMITGDYPGTAVAIAKQIGLKDPEAVMTGAQLASFQDQELGQQIKNISVFARVLPEQKLAIVQALKSNGEIVAMTGDGVNDAPALKAANIGIAMGGRGTDVAREASSLVVLDDDFASIVEAIRNGRKIFENLRKAMSYIFAVHIPTAGMTILPLLFGMPIALFPVHIVFLEMIIDPACSVAFEAEDAEDGVMLRPPRGPKEKLLSWKRIDLSLLQGVVSLAICFAIYVIILDLGRGENEARALSFATLVFSNLGLILTNRSWSNSIIASFKKKNTALVGVLGATVIILASVLYIPSLQRLFHFSILHADDIFFCIAGGLISILWFEILKYIRRKNGKV